MTEKQFKFDSEIGFIDLKKCGGDTLSNKEVVEFLNELHEENQQCENEIARLQLINNKLKDKDYTNYKKKTRTARRKQGTQRRD